MKINQCFFLFFHAFKHVSNTIIRKIYLSNARIYYIVDRQCRVIRICLICNLDVNLSTTSSSVEDHNVYGTLFRFPIQPQSNNCLDLSVPFSPALGLEKQIHVQAPGTEGLMVDCNSGGWFPKPQMECRDSRGEIVPHSSKSYSQDGARLFHMKMTLVLRNQSWGNMTCYICNPLTGEEK